MTTSKHQFERRSHKRFLVKENGFIEFTINPTIIGQMIDISKGGLAFRYVDIGHRPGRSFNLTIFTEENGFGIENVPATIIWDAVEDRRSPFDITSMRRCGVKFEELSENDLSALEDFIQN